MFEEPIKLPYKPKTMFIFDITDFCGTCFEKELNFSK